MLNPLATLAIYGFVFASCSERRPPSVKSLGSPDLRGFCYVQLSWNFFAVVNNIGLTAITSNSGLVR